jgi:hypothetical protein
MDKRGRARKQAVRVEAKQMIPCKQKLQQYIRRKEIMKQIFSYYLKISDKQKSKQNTTKKVKSRQHLAPHPTNSLLYVMPTV